MNSCTEYTKRFTPRRPKSVWSKINTGHIERLRKEGKMTSLGEAAVQAAVADGRWARAYASQKDMQVPDSFLDELQKNKKAYAFYQTLNKTNRFAIAYRLTSPKKEETKKRRAKEFIALFEQGKKLY